MCGIFGALTSNYIKINENIFSHRGPDDWGIKEIVCKNKKLTFFQSRLSIIGLGKQGHQPFSKYNNYVLTYNGEIYNYKELRERLERTYNVEFNTDTDTEVLYELLINAGIDSTLQLLNGIFTFSLYDASNSKLFIARDELGVKPLYYYVDNKSFYYTSEIKALFKLNLVKPKLNKDLLGEYFANGWIYEPDTLFKGIYKLESGTYLSYNIKDESISHHKYWDLELENNSIENTHNSILETIKKQTVADVPYGIYFSGGIDSSIIAYQLKDEKPYYLNLNLNDSESERVRYFEENFDININKTFYDNNLIAKYEKLVYYMDEPIADPAIVPAYVLANKSREQGRIVMLSGMGGDEIDTGYTRHKVLAKKNIFKYSKYFPLFKFLPSKIFRELSRLKAFFKVPTPQNYFSLTAYFTKAEINKLINKNWFANYKEKINSITGTSNSLRHFLKLDIKGFLSSHNLIYMDKASMAASVEVRVPLLDKIIVKSFYNNLDEKEIKKCLKPRLTKLVKEQLGENYFDVKKKGFRLPVDDWMQNEVNWNEIKAFFKKNGLLNISIFENYMKVLENRPAQVSMKLFYIYTLYLWLTTFNVEID